jgi:hypothetical protein
MPHPLVIGYHLVWTGYGWWLPNDPRGSTSSIIRSDVIAELGELHHGRKRIQPASRVIREFYEGATPVLKFLLLTFGTREFECIARAFGAEMIQQRYTCYACAIIPDHVHLLIRKHKHLAEEMIHHLQRASHIGLRDAGIVDWEHPVWGGGGWKVFLDSLDDIRRTIKYIQDNPRKMGLPNQKWSFVKEYDGWPLYPGHSANSPYARRLRGGG